MSMFLWCMGIDDVIVYGFWLMFCDWVFEVVKVLCEVVELCLLYRIGN